MAFKIGDKVEVYRRQERNGYEVVEKGFKGKITDIVNSEYYGMWANVTHPSFGWVGIKLTYLKHIKE